MILIHVAPKWMFWRMAFTRTASLEEGVRLPCVRRGRRTRSFDTSRSSEMVFAPTSPAGQLSEAILGCQILNRMTDFGRATSYSIGR